LEVQSAHEVNHGTLKIHRLVVADTRLQVPIPAGTDDTLMDVSGSVVIRSHMYFVQNTR